jgi:hypothetical protein
MLVPVICVWHHQPPSVVGAQLAVSPSYRVDFWATDDCGYWSVRT